MASVCLLAWLDSNFCLLFLLALLCHEVGHGAAMLALRIPICGIRLGAAGAVITGRFPGYWQELLCALAGPIAGLLGAVFSYRSAPDFSIISACLSALNLLPLYPLDGGRILRSGLLLSMEPFVARRVLQWVTGITCCILMVGACWATVELRSGLWPVFAALVVLWRAGNSALEEL